jgi:hypothetical protein
MNLKFSGPAIISGFPRDKSFSFDLDGDRFILKAGKDVFLTVEREPLKDTDVNLPQVRVEGPANPPVPILENLGGYVPPAPSAEAEAPKERKPRGPNIKINDTDVIRVDPNLENPYGKLRGKYYETLKTANGRTVGWWKETSMVKSLEGDPITMLKFFLSEKIVGLVNESAQPQPTPTQEPVPGPLWAPPGGPVAPSGGNGGGATFM